MLLVFIPLLGIHFVLRTARAQSVTQPDIHITVSEGASLELRCNYSYGATPSLFWYVQSPGQGLQLLLKYFSGDTVVQGIKGFEAEFKRSQYSFNLRKPSVHWSDAAEYFCAAGARDQTGVNNLFFGTGTRLTVLPYPSFLDPTPSISNSCMQIPALSFEFLTAMPMPSTGTPTHTAACLCNHQLYF